jgi:DNA mismatch endonuclease (patch repair protein)
MPLAPNRRRQSPTARPAASSPVVKRRMMNTPKRDTPKELALRRELHGRGLRYLVDVAPLLSLRRRADLVFRGPHIAVFVDGCFWHCCPQHGTTPKSNRNWWLAKLKRNRERDRDTDVRLHQAGWRVIRVWEHEPTGAAADRVERAVRQSCGAASTSRSDHGSEGSDPLS